MPQTLQTFQNVEEEKESISGSKNFRQSKKLTISETNKKKLKDTDFSSYPNLELCSKPMDAGLWVLAVLKKEIGLDEEYFTAEDISSILKIKGYPFKPYEITRGFTKARKKIDKIVVFQVDRQNRQDGSLVRVAPRSRRI